MERVLGTPEVNKINSTVTPASLGLVTFCLVFLVCKSCLYHFVRLPLPQHTFFPRSVYILLFQHPTQRPLPPRILIQLFPAHSEFNSTNSFGAVY